MICNKCKTDFDEFKQPKINKKFSTKIHCPSCKKIHTLGNIFFGKPLNSEKYKTLDNGQIVKINWKGYGTRERMSKKNKIRLRRMYEK